GMPAWSSCPTSLRTVDASTSAGDESAVGPAHRAADDAADAGYGAHDHAEDDQRADVVPEDPVEKRFVGMRAVDAPLPRVNPVGVRLLHLRERIERRSPPERHEETHDDEEAGGRNDAAVPALRSPR